MTIENAAQVSHCDDDVWFILDIVARAGQQIVHPAVIEHVGEDLVVGFAQRVGVFGTIRKRLKAVGTDVAVFGQHECFAVDNQRLCGQRYNMRLRFPGRQQRHVAAYPLVQHIICNGGYNEAVFGQPPLGFLPNRGTEVV